MRSNCRAHILNEAYKLFLFQTTEKVTIFELEKATGKIRGTIFYHFANKQKVFEAVVDEIFLPSFDIPNEITATAIKGTFDDFIQIYQSPEKRVINKIKACFQVESPETGYINFLNQAYKYYPSFKTKYSQIIRKELSVWEKVLIKGKERGIFSSLNPKETAYGLMLLNSGFFYCKAYHEALEFDYSDLLDCMSRLCMLNTDQEDARTLS